jgi:integrase
MAGTKIKLTKDIVSRLTPDEKGNRRDYYDSELANFGIRISPISKKYFIMKSIDGKRVRVTIGDASALTPDDARRLARIKIGSMESGVDPNKAKRFARVKGKTLQKFFEEYLSVRRLKPRTVTTYKKLFRLYLSDWLPSPAADISKEMISRRHAEIAAGKFQQVESEAERKRTEVAADNCMRTLRAVLKFAMDDNQDNIPVNPVEWLTARKQWFGTSRRRRLLTATNLPIWWKAIHELDNITHRDFFLFILFSGLRKDSEAACLAWSDINMAERWFVAPDTKNKEPLCLPLPDNLHRILELRREMFPGEYVFPGRRVAHLVSPSKSIAAVTAVTGIEWSCHDLRRTFVTVAESLDLSPYAIKALVNHKLPANDVTGGYIIMNGDRLREPMQRSADKILMQARRI